MTKAARIEQERRTAGGERPRSRREPGSFPSLPSARIAADARERAQAALLLGLDHHAAANAEEVAAEVLDAVHGRWVARRLREPA